MVPNNTTIDGEGWEEELPVEALCTVIPGQAITDGPQQFSILITPYVAPEPGDTSRKNWSLGLKTDIPLPKLPTVLSNEVDGHEGRFVLFLHTNNPKIVHKFEIKDDGALNGKGIEKKQLLEKLNQLWTKVFDYPANSGNGRSGWQHFHDVLSQPVEMKVASEKNTMPEQPLPDPIKTQTFDMSSISDYFLNQQMWLLIETMVARAMSQKERTDFVKNVTTDFTPEGREYFTQLYNDMHARPFSSDYLSKKWLGEISKIFLSGGGDSASGKLATLSSKNVGTLQHARSYEETINVQVAKLGRLLAAKSDDPQAIANALGDVGKLLQDNINRTTKLGNTDFLAGLVPSSLLKPETTKARDAAIENLKREVELYRDAISFERPIDSTAKKDPSITNEQLRDGVRRKIMALRSHPTLSKCLRLIHDFKPNLSVSDHGKVDLGAVTHVSAAFVPATFKLADLDEHPTLWQKITKTAIRHQPRKQKTTDGVSVAIPDLLVALPRRNKFERALQLYKSSYLVESDDLEKRLKRQQFEYVERLSIGQQITDSGLLNFNSNRYQLNILDTSQAIHVTQSSAQAIVEKSQTGAPPQYTSFDLPQLKSRGIELLDRGASMESVFELAQARFRRFPAEARLDSGAEASADNVLYAEDLQVGMRIDILRYPNTRSVSDKVAASDGKAKVVISPAHARRVFYPEINEIFGRSPSAYYHPFPEFRDRDEGYAGQLSREKTVEESILGADGKKITVRTKAPVISQRLMFWTGEPMGLSRGEADVKDCRLDLPIDIQYEVSFDKNDSKYKGHLLPALREKDGYRVVGRPRFINGDGPNFLFGIGANEDVIKAYEDNSVGARNNSVEPSPPPPPLTFTPPDAIGAPETLYLEGDPLLSASMPQPVLPDKLHTVVIRSYHDPQRLIDSPRRVIVPPHISFDQAEQQGQFDNDDPIPRGDKYMEDVEWDEVAMAFPVKDASYEINNEGKVELKTSRNKQGKEIPWNKQDKGPIFRGAMLTVARGEPNYYFKDTRAKRLALALEDNGRRDQSGSGQSSLIYEPSNGQLKPVMLSFFPESDLSYGNWINNGLPHEELRSSGRRRLELDHLAVHLVPGAELELNLFCPPSWAEMVGQNLFVTSIAEDPTMLNGFGNLLSSFSSQPNNGTLASTSNGVTEEAEKLWRIAAMEVPTTLLNSVEKIKVVHAVQKPLLSPKVRRLTVSYRSDAGSDIQHKEIRAFRMVRREEGPDDWSSLIASAPADGQKTFREAWLYGISSLREPQASPANLPLTDDILALTDVAESTIGYFIGEVAIDRNTTGSLRCDMLFRDVQSEAAKVRENKKWMFRPNIQTRELFSIVDIAKEHSAIPEHLDLAFDDQARPRALSYDFGTKARRIALRFIGTSRFQDFFAENVVNEDGENNASLNTKPVETELAFSDQENASHADLSAALGSHNCPRLDHEKVIFEEEFWVKSTKRPPKPDICEIKYRFNERVLSRGEDSIIYERSCGLRLRLGDHHASGEGELVALVLWPPGLVSDYPGSCPANGDVVEKEHKLTTTERQLSSKLKDCAMDEAQDNGTFCSSKLEPQPSYESTLGRSVTAWGTDPTTSSGFLDPVILPSQFAGYSMKKSSLKMPLTDEGTEETKFHDVAVIGFDPILNEDGEAYWYIDIDVDATRTDSPFLRCALARCQMQSLPGKNLELSQPKVLDPLQLPPKRRVEIQMDELGGVNISVRGAGYTRRSPAFIVRENGDVLDHYTDTPFQNFKLMRRVGSLGSDSFVQMYDAGGSELSLLRVAPVEQDTVLNWTAHFDLPPGISREDVRLSVFESEMNVPDIDGDLPASPEDDLVETIRPFACDLSLAGQRKFELPERNQRQEELHRK